MSMLSWRVLAPLRSGPSRVLTRARHHAGVLAAVPHLVWLWLRMETRARHAARRYRRPALPGCESRLRVVGAAGVRPHTPRYARTVCHGSISTDAGWRPASIALGYDSADPYALRVVVCAEETVSVHVIARDLVHEVLDTGLAGEGRVRMRTVLGRLSVMIDTPKASQAPAVEDLTLLVIPRAAAARALALSENLVPRGREILDIDAAIEALLATNRA